jgi:hypothetical protein
MKLVPAKNTLPFLSFPVIIKAIPLIQLWVRKFPGSLKIFSRFTFHVSLLITLFISLLSILFFSCTRSTKPDISDIQVDLKIARFEEDLFESKQDLYSLRNKYGDFVDFYFDRFINPAANRDTIALQDSLLSYVNDPFFLPCMIVSE